LRFSRRYDAGCGDVWVSDHGGLEVSIKQVERAFASNARRFRSTAAGGSVTREQLK
jgi:hypothetical protein